MDESETTTFMRREKILDSLELHREESGSHPEQNRTEAQLSLFIPANTQVFAFIVGLGENHDDHDKSNFLALYRSELFKNWS